MPYHELGKHLDALCDVNECQLLWGSHSDGGREADGLAQGELDVPRAWGKVDHQVVQLTCQAGRGAQLARQSDRPTVEGGCVCVPACALACMHVNVRVSEQCPSAHVRAHVYTVQRKRMCMLLSGRECVCECC